MNARIQRTVVAFALALAGVLALASCADEATPTATPAPTATVTAQVPASPTATSSPIPPLTRESTAVPLPTKEPTSTPIGDIPPTLLFFMMVDPVEATDRQTLTYTIIVMNDLLTGADPGSHVLIQNILPSNTVYVEGSATSGAVFEAVKRAVIWEGQVPRGQSLAIGFQVRVEGARPGSTIQNVALMTDVLGRVLGAQASTLITGEKEQIPATATPLPTDTLVPTATPLTPPTSTRTPTPPPTPPVITEWRGEYYADRELTGSPALVRNDRIISFSWADGAPAPQVPADNFSARWTRDLEFDGATYRFFITVDDGVRLWIDDALLIDAWYDGGERTVVGTRSMVRGPHSIRLEYYERSGNALARLWWEKDTSYPDWKGEYWSNPDLAGLPALTRNDISLDFNWGVWSPVLGLPEDGFSVRWTRTDQFAAGIYRFYARVDDGARVWVDGGLIIDEWRDGGARTVFADRPMVRGTHSVRVEYYERAGEARARVWWERVDTYSDWKGEYWWNRNLEGAPDFVRNDPEIDFDWGLGAPAANMPSDQFSARWTRTLAFDAGTYRFHATADDTIRVWVDDVLIIDSWSGYNPQEMIADRFLTGGDHQLRVEYAESGGSARVRVWWERIDAFADWKGQYWSNADLAGSPILVRNDANIDFDWGGGSPAGGIPVDQFSARWTRQLSFDGGTYRFHLLVDDVVRLWVDDILLVDTWAAYDLDELVAEQPLIRGLHQIRIEYAERGGNARIRFWWDDVQDFSDWRGEYWANIGLSGPPALVRDDAQIDFYWHDGSPAPGLPVDNFSARWTRTAFFDAATYRFRIEADDLVRLWVDDALLVDVWDVMNPNEITTDVSLSRGDHSLRLEYAERGGSARIFLAWDEIGAYSGWKGEYFNNPDINGAPIVVRSDPKIDFDWGQGSPISGIPKDEFSVRWSREIIWEPDVYRFYARADDGLRFFVDGELILDEWHVSRGDIDYRVDVPLTDRHQLDVEFFDLAFEAKVKFWWERLDVVPQPPLGMWVAQTSIAVGPSRAIAILSLLTPHL